MPATNVPVQNKDDQLLRLPLGAALMAPPPEVEFVLPGLPLGTVGGVIGPGGASKTNFALQTAAAQVLRIPTANGLFDAPGASRRVAFLTGEENALNCTVRLYRIFEHILTSHPELLKEATREEIVHELDQRLSVFPCAGKDIAFVRGGRPTKRLRELEAKVEGCDLLFLETVSRLHNGDENATHAMSAFVSAIESVAQSIGCATVLIHHASKAADLSGRADSQHAARGSSAFVDNCRWIANLFGMNADDARKEGVSDQQRRQFVRFELTKANYLKAPAPCWLRRVEGGLLTYAKAVGSARTRRARSEN